MEVGFKMEMYMTLWKHIKRLWSLLTPEEVFDEHGSLGRRTRVLRARRLRAADANDMIFGVRDLTFCPAGRASEHGERFPMRGERHASR